MRYIMLMMILALTANAGLFSTISGMAMKEVKPKASYTIDTAGINPRVYEWKTTEGKTCVAIFGSAAETSSVAIHCFSQ